MNRIVKTTVTTLLAVALLTSAFAVFAEEEELQPRLYIPQMRHDFGEVFETEIFSHDFVVRNRGKADLLIEKVKPG